MKAIVASTLIAVLWLGLPHLAWAQEALVAQDAPVTENVTDGETEDEVITTGQRTWESHDGMKAFFDGEFEKAEIEFEREFKSLRRFESARENAVNDAQLNFDRADLSASVTNYDGATLSTPGGAVQLQNNVTTNAPDIGLNNNLLREREDGRSILTDGRVDYQDFAFSRYMSGLSEIKLGKYEEAKRSLKQSLSYDRSNYDAQMRLGLIHVQQGDFEKAAKQLETLDKMLKKCRQKACDDLDGMTDSTLTLAKIIIERSDSL